ncbi:CPBP family intramembrane glutamic endopeptidase [Actibacterium lipolyticum]|uniref:CAAX amino terminal protease self- immunity n=1 Tax=Actibacterium lipolyticum TaxID=1524263 RepID=A0A238JLN7_9RHOB|nr:type II CAAX endopeptidase family protein [Actibacterium lipolyticum]SMX30706.1 CAAX amino terminal protease self- immunity [Actibacterium lipolyticum]
MRAPEFAAYIGPARLYPEIWRILLGMLLILFIYIGVFAIMLVALYPIVGPLEYFAWLLKLKAPTEAGPTFFLLLSFIGMGLGPIIAVGACHLRGPGTLFGPADETLRGFFLTVVVLLPLYGGLTALSFWLSPPEQNLAFDTWLGYLPLALPLVFIQTTSEELIFRGYLQQQLAARFVARWVWMGLPALLFTSLHWNPAAGSNIWMILAAVLGFALIAADLTERTGSLGSAMGLHFINNVFAMLFVSVGGTINGLSLFVTPYDVADKTNLPLGLGLDLILLFTVWRLLRYIVAR